MKGSSWKKEGWEGPLRKNDLGDYIGEMTLIVVECHPRWINFKKYDKPSPLEGSYIKSHINHKGLTFETFLLLKKYCNNTSFGFALDLVINSINLHFMVLIPIDAQCMHTTQDTTKQNHTHSNIKCNKEWSRTHQHKMQQNIIAHI